MKKVNVRVNTPSFMYHVNTRNLSFLQTAKDLKTKGIKNNMFFLKLYDKSLEYVNPHSPNLTREQQIAIINECIKNPWYYLRECSIIPEEGGTGMLFRLHRANLAMIFCFLHGIDSYTVIPRQTGKTQSALAIILWSYTFGTNRSEFLFNNKSHEDAINNLKRLKAQRDLLPSFMRFKEVLTDDGKIDKGVDNVRSIENPVNHNRIVTKPKATSLSAAESIGRGNSQPIQFFDEIEFTRHIKTIIEASGPAFNTSRNNAKKNNAAHGRILISTPGDLDDPAGIEALQIVNGTCTWNEDFYNRSLSKIEDYVKVNSDNGIVYIEYSYQQLGYDEEWFAAACQSVLNNPIKIKREINLKRMRGSDLSPFDEEDRNALDELRGHVKEEIFIMELFKLDIYEDLDRDRIYIIGVDCAHGLGQDNTAITILDPYTIKPVAEFKSPFISVMDAGKLLTLLIKNFVPRAILAIERNNVGEAIMDFIRTTPFKRNLYFDDSKLIQVDEILDNKGFLKQEALKRKTYGVWTGNSSRDIMFQILDNHMRNFKDKFVTNNIINDILGLVRKPNGRVEHGVGMHDDSLFSYLIALYVYYHGKNLKRFGFIRGVSPDEENKKELSYEEILNMLPEKDRSYFNTNNFRTDLLKDQQTQYKTYNDYMTNIDFSQGAERIDDEMDETGSISIDFFDYLNE